MTLSDALGILAIIVTVGLVGIGLLVLNAILVKRRLNKDL
jgi:hypothetical protein